MAPALLNYPKSPHHEPQIAFRSQIAATVNRAKSGCSLTLRQLGGGERIQHCAARYIFDPDVTNSGELIDQHRPAGKHSALAKQPNQQLIYPAQNLKGSLPHVAVHGTFELLPATVSPRMPADLRAQIGQPLTWLPAEPEVARYGQRALVDLKPNDAAAGLLEQPGTDGHVPDAGARKARLQLDMPEDPIGLQYDIVTAAIDLALEHLDVVAPLSPARGHELAKQQMEERLLPNAGGARMGREGILIQFK